MALFINLTPEGNSFLCFLHDQHGLGQLFPNMKRNKIFRSSSSCSRSSLFFMKEPDICMLLDQAEVDDGHVCDVLKTGPPVIQELNECFPHSSIILLHSFNPEFREREKRSLPSSSSAATHLLLFITVSKTQESHRYIIRRGSR